MGTLANMNLNLHLILIFHLIGKIEVIFCSLPVLGIWGNFLPFSRLRLGIVLCHSLSTVPQNDDSEFLGHPVTSPVN